MSNGAEMLQIEMAMERELLLLTHTCPGFWRTGTKGLKIPKLLLERHAQITYPNRVLRMWVGPNSDAWWFLLSEEAPLPNDILESWQLRYRLVLALRTPANDWMLRFLAYYAGALGIAGLVLEQERQKQVQVDLPLEVVSKRMRQIRVDLAALRKKYVLEGKQ